MELEDYDDDVGVDEPLPEDPKISALRAEGWGDYEGQTYAAFCQSCNNAAGLMVRASLEPSTLEVMCKGCLVWGHPSFAEENPGEVYHDNDYKGPPQLELPFPELERASCFFRAAI